MVESTDFGVRIIEILDLSLTSSEIWTNYPTPLQGWVIGLFSPGYRKIK